MFDTLVQAIVNGVVSFCSDFLFPLMFVGFFVAITLKSLILASTQRQIWFGKEFEKRVVRLLSAEGAERHGSFYHHTKRILEITYYQLFEVRAIMMRRKLDYVTSPLDRLFGTQPACAIAVQDTLQQIKHLNRDKDQPDFLNISKTTFSRNPYFARLFGWLNLGTLNDLVNLLPGLYIIGGIFGTFLGIMEALPELSHLNLSDPEGSKLIMDTFLLKIAFSISTSIVGIIFSVTLTIIYSTMSPEKKYLALIDSYSTCLNRLWNYSLENTVLADKAKFDEHRDAIEALAELSVEKGLQQARDNKDRDAYSPATTPEPEEKLKKAS